MPGDAWRCDDDDMPGDAWRCDVARGEDRLPAGWSGRKAVTETETRRLASTHSRTAHTYSRHRAAPRPRTDRTGTAPILTGEVNEESENVSLVELVCTLY